MIKERHYRTTKNSIVLCALFLFLVFSVGSFVRPGPDFLAIANSNRNFTNSSNSITTINASTNYINATDAQNNVTTASGNNGHIYRGGAAAGPGGE